jgi:hypothetical protein
MQSVYDYLKKSGKEAELGTEPVYSPNGLVMDEPVIDLHGQPLQSLSLYVADGISCAATGGILRFHYLVKLPRELKPGEASLLTASTRAVKENRVAGLFGGKISGVKWSGKDLAEALNKDEDLNRILLGCATTTGEIDFTIDTLGPDEVHIWGPRFSNPLRLRDRFKAMESPKEQECIFCIDTIDRIARHIKELIPGK